MFSKINIGSRNINIASAGLERDEVDIVLLLGGIYLIRLG